MNVLYKYCFKTPCAKCVNRDKERKSTLFNKYPCKLEKKLQKNSCFYFKCEGKDNGLCERCKYLFKEDDT
jgi:hypothetical protein